MSFFSVPALPIPPSSGPLNRSAWMFFQRDDGQTVGITFDVVESETHEKSNTITDHPVEQGEDISDHVKGDPDRLTLDAFVTGHPIHDNSVPQFKDDNGSFRTLDVEIPEYRVPLIDTSGSLPTLGSPTRVATQAVSDLFASKPKPRTLQFPDDDLLRIQKVYDLLTEVKEGAIYVNVITAFKLYENMIVEHFNAERTSETGSGANFAIQLRQINVVTTQTVTGVTLKVAPKLPRASAKVDAGKKGLGEPETEQSLLVKLGLKAGLLQ